MKKVQLWKGYRTKAYPTDLFSLVDDEDYDRVINFHGQWRLHRMGYAVCGKDGKTVLLHRFILGLTDPDIHVDHHDHDKLNNSKANLIPGTQTDNNRNAPYIGVGFHKAAGKWRAWARYDCRHLGLFDTEAEALESVRRHNV